MNFKFIDIFVILFIIFCCIPHYDKNCNIVLFGQFYSKKKSKEFLDLIQSYNSLPNLKNQIKTNQTKYNSLSRENNKLKDTIKNIYKKHTSCLENLEKIEENNQTLKYKLQQQHQFYENQEKSKQKKKETFSKVSKKVIHTKRPEIGNIYSKSLKKSQSKSKS